MNIAVIFGGVSCEHDISIITGMQVINNLDIDKYNIYPIYITKDGKFLYNSQYLSCDKVVELRNSKECFFVPNDNNLYAKAVFGRLKKVSTIDVVILALHGINGEDGIIKSVCDISNIPCINSDILPSALALDKCVSNYYFSSFDNINIVNGFKCNPNLAESEILKEMEKNNIQFPIIIKPSRLGSSIGITVCHSQDELSEKLNYSYKFDQNVLIQKKLNNFIEYNIAILQDCNDLIVSEVEQPVNNDEILSYSDKYLSGGKKSGGMAELKRIFPAKVDMELKNEIISTAKFVYNNLQLSGVVRFDFIYDNDNKILYLNELNTIPGSYAYYLFPNLTFSEILDKCIKNIFFVKQSKEKLIRYFESSVLKSVGCGIKK